MITWRSARFKILNRLRQGPATQEELHAFCKEGTSLAAVNHNVRRLRLLGHVIRTKIHAGGKTIFTLVYDAQKDIAESYWAIEKMGPVTKPKKFFKVKAEEEYHKEDGTVKKKYRHWSQDPSRRAEVMASTRKAREAHLAKKKAEELEPQPSMPTSVKIPEWKLRELRWAAKNAEGSYQLTIEGRGLNFKKELAESQVSNIVRLVLGGQDG